MVPIDKFKLSAVTWDSDKNPTGFTKWMSEFSSLVASTEHGATLEKFLDEKLDRRKNTRVTVPSFITTDDDFLDGLASDEVPDPEEDENASQEPL